MNMVDQKSFQTFLSNAFAVQESGLDPHSLSALIEIQRFLTSDDFDLDRAMQMVADRALEVCSASGVAIALLEAGRNELVYKAGSGNAGKDVGRRVPAVMSGSALQESRREILRVEDAGTDKRIEAEVCRQFGATALLMLPICPAHVLTGVLQVLFDSAHSFADGEVRIYRLMASALEEVILRSAQTQRAVSTVENVSPHVAGEQCLPTDEDGAGASGMFADASQQNASRALRSDPAVAQPEVRTSHDHPAMVQELGGLRTAVSRAIAPMEVRAWSANSRYAGPAIAAAVLLTIVVLISHLRPLPDANLGSSFPRPQDGRQQAPARAVSAHQSETVPDDEAKQTAVPAQGFKRVRVGPEEVDYMAEDVTIRTFQTRPEEGQIPRSAHHQISFGDDVTVRYFASTPTLESGQPGGSDTQPPANQSSH
jgi:hypothetical protein